MFFVPSLVVTSEPVEDLVHLHFILASLGRHIRGYVEDLGHIHVLLANLVHHIRVVAEDLGHLRVLQVAIEGPLLQAGWGAMQPRRQLDRRLPGPSLPGRASRIVLALVVDGNTSTCPTT